MTPESDTNVQIPFWKFITTSPFHRGGPNRWDYINAVAMTAVFGCGGMIFHLLFHLDSTLAGLAIKLSGGAIFGLGYLYAAYKISTRQPAYLQEAENPRKMHPVAESSSRKVLPTLSMLSCGATLSLMLYFVSGSSAVSALLALLLCGAVAATYCFFN